VLAAPLLLPLPRGLRLLPLLLLLLLLRLIALGEDVRGFAVI
jgi:hypothetical protein